MISVKIHKPSISYFKSNKIYEKEKIIHNYLLSKYSKFEYSYSLVCINNLIFNEHCRIVARFKDFLILDDMTEFLRRFYTKRELKRRLTKIYNFYESYSKIFPNYMILPESKYLYRNIRKKQKMIDAFNQIKKEEEENRNSLKKELNNKERGEIMIFNRSIQESINRYHPSGASFLFNSIMSGFMKNTNNNESNLNSIISISLNKAYPLNNKKINNKNSKQNSLEFDNSHITQNSENSLINIVKILNQKYGNDNKIENNYFKKNNSNNKTNDKNQYNHKNRNNYNNEKVKKIKNQNIVKKDTKTKKVNKININNNTIENNTVKIEKDKNKDKKIISTPPKNTSPPQTHMMKGNNHQKSALNNNRKFISHKQAVSVSNNNNTIKIINNINNIIINDANINKEMVININTNYFDLNNANINTINTINKITDQRNNNIDKNIKNALIKKVKMNSKSKSKSKETSINNKKENNYFSKKISNNFKSNHKNNNNNNYINNTVEEKRISSYSNNILSNINYDNNIINNNVINIHDNNTATNNTKNNKSRVKKKQENKNIKGISEYKALNINSIGNIGNLYTNKNKINYIKKERNKKAITIEIEQIEKIKKSQSKKRKTLDILINTENKKTSNKPMFNTKTHIKKNFEILNTDGNNHDIRHVNTNTYSTNYNYNFTEHKINTNNNNNINNKNPNDVNSVKSDQIKTKLNKKIMSRKQKTNSLQINNKNNFFSSFNNNKISKEVNLLKKNNITNNDNFINEHTKTYIQTLDIENTRTKKFLNSNERKRASENKFKKISAKEMKEKYHKFMQGNKFIHGSYDTSNRLHLFKKFSSLYNSHNTNNNNITEISQRKILDIKSPFKINNILSTPGSKISNQTISSNLNNNMLGSNYKNYVRTSYRKKMQMGKKEGIQEKNKYFIYKINGLKNKIFISDANNKKMKFVKK